MLWIDAPIYECWWLWLFSYSCCYSCLCPISEDLCPGIQSGALFLIIAGGYSMVLRNCYCNYCKDAVSQLSHPSLSVPRIKNQDEEALSQLGGVSQEGMSCWAVFLQACVTWQCQLRLCSAKLKVALLDHPAWMATLLDDACSCLGK